MAYLSYKKVIPKIQLEVSKVFPVNGISLVYVMKLLWVNSLYKEVRKKFGWLKGIVTWWALSLRSDLTDSRQVNPFSKKSINPSVFLTFISCQNSFELFFQYSSTVIILMESWFFNFFFENFNLKWKSKCSNRRKMIFALSCIISTTLFFTLCYELVKFSIVWFEV